MSKQYLISVVFGDVYMRIYLATCRHAVYPVACLIVLPHVLHILDSVEPAHSKTGPIGVHQPKLIGPFAGFYLGLKHRDFEVSLLSCKFDDGWAHCYDIGVSEFSEVLLEGVSKQDVLQLGFEFIRLDVLFEAFQYAGDLFFDYAQLLFSIIQLARLYRTVYHLVSAEGLISVFPHLLLRLGMKPLLLCLGKVVSVGIEFVIQLLHQLLCGLEGHS